MRKTYQKLKERCAYLLEPGTAESGWAKAIDVFITLIIIVNLTVLIIDSVPDIPLYYRQNFYLLEVFTVLFFTIEYVLRIWIAPVTEVYSRFKRPRVGFVLSFYGIVDLLAILPFYLNFMFGLNYYYLMVFRLFRIFKLFRYFTALQLLGRVFRAKFQELMFALFFIIIMLIFVSFLMFYVENKAQPEVFRSIPETMWWGIITLTTVGYGDMHPITPVGKFLGGIIALMGIGLFALPAGILAGGFSTELQKIAQEDTEKDSMEASTTCPHCGKQLKE
ncbi:ion transporter [Schleiferia thermophila]|jgi:voltage-gated potassium channel|uniref:ion transporter n=1 Tax=Schleiferia thermophila TaxID=884107 RepID=UPI000CB3EC98|nr:potassium channel protein [Fischerella thermalis CCMEE 5319]